ncbi:MAG: uroporphyrinogen-III C-methyltransferase [Myxococcota bacterium]
MERKMIQLARQGLTVARVKGGDPYVFGRGGEEVDALARAGIIAEVVPGIPAGVAAPAAAGIPITHRDHCHGVTFVTAHTRGGREPNWSALAASGTTLVIYMGVARAARVAEGLTAGGMAAATPVAVIENATRPEMRTVVTRLDRLADVAARQRVVSPAVIVVGNVVRCAVLARQAVRRAA